MPRQTHDESKHDSVSALLARFEQKKSPSSGPPSPLFTPSPSRTSFVRSPSQSSDINGTGSGQWKAVQRSPSGLTFPRTPSPKSPSVKEAEVTEKQKVAPESETNIASMVPAELSLDKSDILTEPPIISITIPDATNTESQTTSATVVESVVTKDDEEEAPKDVSAVEIVTENPPTVVEVVVDAPNAAVEVVEDAPSTVAEEPTNEVASAHKVESATTPITQETPAAEEEKSASLAVDESTVAVSTIPDSQMVNEGSVLEAVDEVLILEPATVAKDEPTQEAVEELIAKVVDAKTSAEEKAVASLPLSEEPSLKPTEDAPPSAAPTAEPNVPAALLKVEASVDSPTKPTVTEPTVVSATAVSDTTIPVRPSTPVIAKEQPTTLPTSPTKTPLPNSPPTSPRKSLALSSLSPSSPTKLTTAEEEPAMPIWAQFARQTMLFADDNAAPLDLGLSLPSTSAAPKIEEPVRSPSLASEKPANTPTLSTSVEVPKKALAAEEDLKTPYTTPAVPTSFDKPLTSSAGPTRAAKRNSTPAARRSVDATHTDAPRRKRTANPFAALFRAFGKRGKRTTRKASA